MKGKPRAKIKKAHQCLQEMDRRYISGSQVPTRIPTVTYRNCKQPGTTRKEDLINAQRDSSKKEGEKEWRGIQTRLIGARSRGTIAKTFTTHPSASHNPRSSGVIYINIVSMNINLRRTYQALGDTADKSCHNWQTTRTPVLVGSPPVVCPKYHWARRPPKIYEIRMIPAAMEEGAGGNLEPQGWPNPVSVQEKQRRERLWYWPKEMK